MISLTSLRVRAFELRGVRLSSSCGVWRSDEDALGTWMG